MQPPIIGPTVISRSADELCGSLPESINTKISTFILQNLFLLSSHLFGVKSELTCCMHHTVYRHLIASSIFI